MKRQLMTLRRVLRRGIDLSVLDSLGGQTSAVQVDREGMDEGEQADNSQPNVHLQTHEGEKERGGSEMAKEVQVAGTCHVLTYKGSPPRTSFTRVKQGYCSREKTADRAMTTPNSFPKWHGGKLHTRKRRENQQNPQTNTFQLLLCSKHDVNIRT